MKSKIIGIGLGIGVAALALVNLAHSQSVPGSVNYQGRLTNAAGQPLDGVSVNLTFTFYPTQSSSTPFLAVTQPSVPVSKGIYNLLIGSGGILPGTETTLAGVFQNNTEVWMGVQVNSDPEMTPRTRIASVPFALNAGRLEGYEAADFAQSFHQHSGNDITSGTIGNSYLSCYSDLGAENYLNNDADTDLLTRLQADGRFVNEGQADSITSGMVQFNYAGSSSEGGSATSAVNSDQLDSQHGAYYQNASNLNAGTLGTGYYSAYLDLGSENYLNNDADTDLLTRLQADGRFVNEGQADSITSGMVQFNYAGSSSEGGSATSAVTSDQLDGQHGSYYQNATNINAGTLANGYFSAYSDLGAEGYLDNNADTDLLTRLQADGRYVNEGQVNSIYTNMIVDGEVGSADVGFNYAGSSSKGGAATSALDLTCTDCVSAAEVQFNYAGSSSEGGAASNSDQLDGQHGSYYQNASNINAGTLGTGYYSAYSDLGAENYLSNDTDTDLLTRLQADGRFVNEGQADSITSAMITDGQVGSADVGFNYAGSATKGGAATSVDLAYLRNLDLDGDGHYKPISSNTPHDDCDDGDPAIYPGHLETCGDGIDSNCRNGDCYLAGAYDTPGSAFQVYVSGSYAYVADAGSGLQIINISNPAAPTLAGTYYNEVTAEGVYVSGSYAYVADGPNGLVIINISNPAAPTLAGTYNTLGTAYAVYVSGSYAYVANGSYGLVIINIANPAAPTLVGTYDTLGNAFGVYVSGSYAYVAETSSGLQIINVSTPSTPTLAGTYDTPGNAYGVYVSGSYAYVADYSYGLQIINVSNPAAPTLAGTYNTPGLALGVYVSGIYTYVADSSSGGLQIIFAQSPP